MTRAVSGIILAGGDSRRMGRDKAHLPWGGATLIEHVVETLRPAVDELLVVVKDACEFAGLEARVVEDRIPDAHALGGLYTGLTLANSERCFVCACDCPFLNPQLVQFLSEQLEMVDLVIPKTDRGLEPLHAAYGRSALPTIEAQVRQGQWNLHTLVPKLRTRVIEPEQWRLLDHEGLSFFNVNTPEDYATAQARAGTFARSAFR